MSKQAHDKNVYIIHGFDASSTRHWFPWLNKFLTDKGGVSRVLCKSLFNMSYLLW